MASQLQDLSQLQQTGLQGTLSGLDVLTPSQAGMGEAQGDVALLFEQLQREVDSMQPPPDVPVPSPMNPLAAFAAQFGANLSSTLLRNPNFANQVFSTLRAQMDAPKAIEELNLKQRSVFERDRHRAKLELTQKRLDAAVDRAAETGNLDAEMKLMTARGNIQKQIAAADNEAAKARAELQADATITSRKIGAGATLGAAQIGAESREKVAEIGAASREKVAGERLEAEKAGQVRSGGATGLLNAGTFQTQLRLIQQNKLNTTKEGFDFPIVGLKSSRKLNEKGRSELEALLVNAVNTGTPEVARNAQLMLARMIRDFYKIADPEAQQAKAEELGVDLDREFGEE